MIATDNAFRLFVQTIAPMIWRNEAKIAAKLQGFASTESGSALDMFKAAELETDPKLRRLFFQHALDEARHAKIFQEAAQDIASKPDYRSSSYNLIRATRQNLYQELGLIQFIAFVYLSERKGEAHFRSLAKHFSSRPEIREVFDAIAKDEKFHVSYSKTILDRWTKQGRGREVRKALRSVRMSGAWNSWRRAGRRIGDLIARMVVGSLYFTVVPWFAVMQRLFDPERTGWKKPQRSMDSIEAARKQF